VDWETRWRALKQHASQLVDQLCISVQQLPTVSETLFPVYIAGWVPIDVTGTNIAGINGPVPPAKQRQVRSRGSPQRTTHSRDTGRAHSYDSARSRDRRDQDSGRDKRRRVDQPLRTSPPDFATMLGWYSARTPTCLTCGSADHAFRHCKSRQVHFPHFEVDMEALKQARTAARSRTQGTAAVVTAEPLPPPPPLPTPSRVDLGSRYPHADTRSQDRGRSQERGNNDRGDRNHSRSRDRVSEGHRDRDRSASRGRQPETPGANNFRPARSGNA